MNYLKFLLLRVFFCITILNKWQLSNYHSIYNSLNMFERMISKIYFEIPSLTYMLEMASFATVYIYDILHVSFVSICTSVFKLLVGAMWNKYVWRLLLLANSILRDHLLILIPFSFHFTGKFIKDGLQIFPI